MSADSVFLLRTMRPIEEGSFVLALPPDGRNVTLPLPGSVSPVVVRTMSLLKH